MGAEATTNEQTPPETTPENVEALLEAARYNDIDDVISLASAGVFLDCKDSQGRTGFDYKCLSTLHAELWQDWMLCIQSSEPALHMATANGHLDIVDYLISKRVDVNASNVEKNTPLHWACLNGHVEVIKSLILAGASVSALNSHERTPVDEAVSGGKMDVINAINMAEAQIELTNARVS